MGAKPMHDLFDGSDSDLVSCERRPYTVSDALNAFNAAYIGAKCVASQLECRHDQKRLVEKIRCLLAQLDTAMDELEDTRAP